MNIISVVPIERKSRLQKYTRTYPFTIKKKEPYIIYVGLFQYINKNLIQVTQDKLFPM